MKSSKKSFFASTRSLIAIVLVVASLYVWQEKVVAQGTQSGSFASPLTVTGASGAEAIIQVNGTTAGAGIGFSETAKGSSWRIKTASADGRLRFINVNTDIKTDVLSIMADNRIRIPGLAGSGNAFLCFDKDGYIYRSDTACTTTSAQKPKSTPITAANNFSLTITKNGTGSGDVVCDYSVCSSSYPSGTQVTLTAIPSTNNNIFPSTTNTFSGWGGDCTGTASNCVLTMNAAKSVTATFTPRMGLTITKNGTGSGDVVCDYSVCSPSYPSGTQVTLTAIPSTNNTFSGWSGDCTGTASNCVLTMNAAKSVTTTFTLSSAPPPPVACTDTDNGLDFHTLGMVTGKEKQSGRNFVNEKDYCIYNKAVHEFYCQPNNLVDSRQVACPLGCSNGKCNNESVPNCTDSDNGINIYVKGTVIGTNGVSYDDFSSNGGIGVVYERTCTTPNPLNPYGVFTTAVVCPDPGHHASDGKCD